MTDDYEPYFEEHVCGKLCPVPLSPSQFTARWRSSSLPERSAAQPHFLDLCEMLGEPHPAACDSVGERFTFEKYVRRTSGGKGFADVWRRDHFAWEYKGKHKDLKAAYKQLNDYREDLGNPPLLVVCDLDRFEVHTNFTSTQKRVYAFDLDDLERNQPTALCPLPPLEVLRSLFSDTSLLRPDRTDARVTQEVAKVFSRLAERLEIEKRSHTDSPIHTKEEIAHFLMRLLFCLFADSIELLPKHVFRNLLQSEDRFQPKKFLRKLKLLYEAMSAPDGVFGEHSIRYFNGGLFDSNTVIELDKGDLGILYDVSKNYNWAHVAPEIFGTLFERSLNAERRSLIGAHYTSAEDILLLIEPVLMQPLERRWAEVRANILDALDSERASSKRQSQFKSSPKAEALLGIWINELTSVRVLDPACGSGNFLYLALRRMLDLWLEAQHFASHQGISLVLPKMVSPSQIYGIESEFYAHELASIVVWIGFLQWKHEHGVIDDREPILQKLSNIEHADAIMRYEAGKPYEPEWPGADFIVGNPPFLGDKMMRAELGDSYVDDLRALYNGRVPGGADLVTYWFEKARAQIDGGRARRAGLIATNSIRMVGNRPVLSRIKKSGNIFMAWSDKPWVLDGAAVRISIIGFDDGSTPGRVLNGAEVDDIHPDLTSGSSTVQAIQLQENENLCFLGIMKGGPFDIDPSAARKMLHQPTNPNGRPNSDVVHPRIGGQDITGRNRGGWVIDFVEMAEDAASLYEMPFEYVRQRVKPVREHVRDPRMRRLWWLHGRSRPALRERLTKLGRYIVTSEVAKHRIFVWMSTDVLPDHSCHVIARDDDYMLGVLQSRVHNIWTLKVGSTLEDRPRYTSEQTFSTFPFPWPPGTEPFEADSSVVQRIADAARELVRLRDAWLNPPGAPESELKKRTLTNLYNDRPMWLENAHQSLDEAVLDAYSLAHSSSKDEILAHLLQLNRERAHGIVATPSTALPPKKAPRTEKSLRAIVKRRVVSS